MSLPPLEFLLERYIFRGNRTIGRLFLPNRTDMFCHTLEDAVRERKIPRITAIPCGLYPLDVTWSSKFAKDMVAILDVPGYAGIRIHSGLDIDHTDGCPLVGYGLHSKTGTLYGPKASTDLRAAVKEVLSVRRACIRIAEIR